MKMTDQEKQERKAVIRKLLQNVELLCGVAIDGGIVPECPFMLLSASQKWLKERAIEVEGGMMIPDLAVRKASNGHDESPETGTGTRTETDNVFTLKPKSRNDLH